MRIFLAHSNQDKSIAEPIALSLRARGHAVFFDKDSLPPGKSFELQIERAINKSDLFIFLATDNSLKEGSFTLTELRYAKKKWPNPKHHILPVLPISGNGGGISKEILSLNFGPHNVLRQSGNLPAEVSHAVQELRSLTVCIVNGLKFSTVGIMSGIISSFLPFTGKSWLNVKIGDVAIDSGIVFGIAIAVAIWIWSGPRSWVSVIIAFSTGAIANTIMIYSSGSWLSEIDIPLGATGELREHLEAWNSFVILMRSEMFSLGAGGLIFLYSYLVSVYTGIFFGSIIYFCQHSFLVL